MQRLADAAHPVSVSVDRTRRASALQTLLRRRLAPVARAVAGLLFLATLAADARSQVTGRGAEFWACWPRTHLSLETSAELIVMSDSPVDVSVDGAFAAGPRRVSPGVPWIVPIPSTLRLAAERTVLNGGFRVVSSDPLIPLNVTLRVPRQAEASDDTARLLPVSELGTRYLINAYQSSLPNEPSLYAVIATEDGTTVRAGRPCGAGPDVTVLNRGQVWQVFCGWRDVPNDVTGAEITSDRPVAVLAGNSDAWVPTTHLSGDFIVEQMAPVVSWGRDFYVVPSPLGPRAVPGAHDIVRVLASGPGTVVFDDGGLRVPFAVAGAGAFFDAPVSSPVRITADVDVDVQQFATGVEMSDMGDPFMASVPAVTHWGPGARAYIPAYYTLGNFLTIMTESAATGSVRLDGAPVTGWRPLPGGTHEFAMVDAGALAGERVVACDAPVHVLAHGYNDTYLPDPALGRAPGSHGTPAAHARPPCAVVASLNVPATSCLGATVRLRESGSTAAGCGALEFRWLENGTPIAACDFSPTGACDVTFRGDATYILEARCVAEPTCIGTVSQRVVNQPAPPVAIVPDPAVTCAGQPLALEASAGFVLYAWTSDVPDPGVTPRSSALAGITVTPDVDTIYTVTAFDVRGCASVGRVTVTTLPDLMPPAIDASVRVTKPNPPDVLVTWRDLIDPWPAYEVVCLECASRDWRNGCAGRAPDPVTIQAAPLIAPGVLPGVEAQVHANAFSRGDLLFYKARAVTSCRLLPGPTCNPWPMQIPPCP